MFASSAGFKAAIRPPRAYDLQQKLAVTRESDPIRRDRARSSAKPRQVSLTRSRRETVTFRHPFRIKGIDRQLRAGAYEVVTDEELIEGLSFPAFRRVATVIMVPGAPPHQTSTEMLSIAPTDLADAQAADAAVSP
jgi:hypothetical protein